VIQRRRMIISLGGLTIAGSCGLVQALGQTPKRSREADKGSKPRFSLTAVNSRIETLSATRGRGDQASATQWNLLMQDWQTWAAQNFEMTEAELAAMRRIDRKTVADVQKALTASGHAGNPIRVATSDANTTAYGQGGNMATARASCKKVVIEPAYNFAEKILSVKLTFEFP